MHLFRSKFQRMRKISRQRGKLLHLFHIRIVMRPVQKRDVTPEKFLGYHFVCRQHKLLDDFRSCISLIRDDFYCLPSLVHFYLALWKIKINWALLFPVLSQYQGKLFHILKHRNQLLIPLPCLLIVVGHNGIHIGITHSLVHADNRLVNFGISNLSIFIIGNHTAQSQAVFPLIQRADAIRKLVGNHRNYPVCQIDARSPQKGFLINGCALPDIMTYICDMNAQLITAVFCPAQRNRIVQILGFLPVNRHRLPLSVIQALPDIFRHYLRRKFSREPHRHRWKFLRQFIGAYNWQNIDTRVVFMSKNFKNFSRRALFRALSEILDFHNNLVSVHGFHRISFRDVNITRNLCIIRENKSKMLVSHECPHKGFMRPHKNADNLPLTAFPLVFLRTDNRFLSDVFVNLHHYRIPVKRWTDVHLRHKHVLIPSIQTDKSKSAACRHKRPPVHILGRKPVSSIVPHEHPPLSYQFIQNLVKLVSLASRYAKQTRQFLLFHRLIIRLFYKIIKQFFFFHVFSIQIGVVKLRKPLKASLAKLFRGYYFCLQNLFTFKYCSIIT